MVEWQQDTGIMYAGGNSKNLYAWDVEKEMCCAVFPADAGSSCVTAMTTHNTYDKLLLAGCGDGSLKLVRFIFNEFDLAFIL